MDEAVTVEVAVAVEVAAAVAVDVVVVVVAEVAEVMVMAAVVGINKMEPTVKNAQIIQVLRENLRPIIPNTPTRYGGKC